MLTSAPEDSVQRNMVVARSCIIHEIPFLPGRACCGLSETAQTEARFGESGCITHMFLLFCLLTLVAVWGE